MDVSLSYLLSYLHAFSIQWTYIYKWIILDHVPVILLVNLVDVFLDWDALFINEFRGKLCDARYKNYNI